MMAAVVVKQRFPKKERRTESPAGDVYRSARKPELALTFSRKATAAVINRWGKGRGIALRESASPPAGRVFGSNDPR
jgi:hypothetical protein